jgi:hypothetical protein
MANAQLESSQSDNPGTHGITETVDLLDAAKETALKVLEEVQDGLDPVDAVQVVLDGDVRDSWAQAAEGAGQIDEELVDLSSEEAFDLARKSTDIGEAIFNEVTGLAPSDSSS